MRNQIAILLILCLHLSVLAAPEAPVEVTPQVETLQLVPARTGLIDDHTLFLEVGKKNPVAYVLPILTADPVLLQAYAEMSPAARDTFQKNRKMILKNIAAALNSVKLAAGVGAVIGDTLTFLREVMDTVTLNNKNYPPNAGAPRTKVEPKGTIAERQKKMIESAIKTVDAQLWMNSRTVAEASEFSVFLGPTATLEAGVQKKGFGGLIDIGFVFGFDFKNQAFLFALSSNIERFRSTVGATGQIGIGFKMGVRVEALEAGKEMQVSKGTIRYPIGIPVFAESTHTGFAVGATSMIISMPPPPLDSVVNFENRVLQPTLFRITNSVARDGFLTVHIPGKTFKFKKGGGNKGRSVVDLLAENNPGQASGLCRKVFLY